MKYMQKCSRNFTMNQKMFPILGKKWQISKLKDREAQKPILSRRLGELHWSRRFMHHLEDSEIKMFVVIGDIHLVKLGENFSKNCKYLIC